MEKYKICNNCETLLQMYNSELCMVCRDIRGVRCKYIYLTGKNKNTTCNKLFFHTSSCENQLFCQKHYNYIEGFRINFD